MNNIAIAICGSSGIDYISNNHNMKVFRSKIQINNVEYIDYIDISVEEFYFLLDGAKELHTAQVSTGELIQIIKEYKAEGITDLIMISISSGLSGTFHGIGVASLDIEGINVYAFDSLFVGYPEANLGLIGMDMIKKGYSVQDILKVLTHARDNSEISFTVDTLEYLRLNGRLSNASAFVGTLLKIKPILYFTKEGKVEVKEKIRTKSKAIDRLVNNFINDTPNDVIPFLVYTNNYEEVKMVKELIFQKTTKFSKIELYPLPPVIGVHAGPGALGVGYVPFDVNNYESKISKL